MEFIGQGSPGQIGIQTVIGKIKWEIQGRRGFLEVAMGRTSTQGHLLLKRTNARSQEPVMSAVPGWGRSGWRRACGCAPLFQLAGSPSLRTVSLTFSIQVSGLKCRYEQFFLLQHSQTGEEGSAQVCPPTFLFLPRQNEREGDEQNQTGRWALPQSASHEP